MTTRSAQDMSLTRPWTWIAIGGIVAKVVMIVIALIVAQGIPGVIPPMTIEVNLFLTLGFLASGAIFLLLRHWFGGVTVFAYACYTLIGAPFSLGDTPIWLIAVMVTSVVALVGVIGAFARREISFTRPAKGNSK